LKRANKKTIPKNKNESRLKYCVYYYLFTSVTPANLMMDPNNAFRVEVSFSACLVTAGPEKSPGYPFAARSVFKRVSAKRSDSFFAVAVDATGAFSFCCFAALFVVVFTPDNSFEVFEGFEVFGFTSGVFFVFVTALLVTSTRCGRFGLSLFSRAPGKHAARRVSF
jgi:hypothetical protein|tara:strand:+ start:347 stop:844 length:498 start_codon:yes stop_codon:yes gene_type:complete